MHSVIIACTITTLITTYIYIASFKVQLSQQLHCSVSYRWGYCNTLLGLSRLAVSNRLQPVSLRYANHASLHQPCTRRMHPKRDAQRRADTNARLTLGHL